MTARKASKKKTAGKKKTRSALELDVPKTLKEYGKQVRKNLNQLERDIERAIPTARRRMARLIRDASHELGQLEARGEAAWKRRSKENHARLLKLARAVAGPAAKKKRASKKAAKRS